MFKIGYFRSSYNSGGINRVLANMGLPTLDEIMGANDNYVFQPNWKKALENVESVIEQLKTNGAYRVELGERDCTYVVTESDNSWYIQALEIVKETIQYVLNSETEEQYYLHWSG